MKTLPGLVGRFAVIGVWLVAAGLVAALCGVLFLFLLRQDQARADYGPPRVLITSPDTGAALTAGSYHTVAATIFGAKPIARAELWVDGVLKETRPGLSSQDSSPLYAHFELLVPTGRHLLFVRGIDTAGSIGQSVPLVILGGPPPAKISYVVPVQVGETLAEIASTYSTDIATIKSLNPGLGEGEPVPDTFVIVPGQVQEASAPVPAADISGGSAPEGGLVPMPGTPPLDVGDVTPGTIGILLEALLVKSAPTAPSHLLADVSNCKVKLRWDDDSDNESRYDVWMSSPASTPRVIASLKPATGGTVWYEFIPLQTGALSLWVEAANSIGGRPSNIVPVVIDSKCAAASTHMSVQALEMNVGGGVDKTYCYVSFQGAPEIRLPTEPMQFVNVQGEKGIIAGTGQQNFAIPIPAGGALDITGECWGWSGKTLNLLGNFSRQIAADEWDGRKIELKGARFSVWISISSARQPFAEPSPGAGQACGGFILDDPKAKSPLDVIDPSLPVPFGISVMSKAAGGVPGINPSTSIYWEWKGDAKTICGFIVYVDGKPLGLVNGADKRGFPLDLPLSMCGRMANLQVAANSGTSRSNLSDPYPYNLRKCQAYLMVKFNKITVYPPGENESDMCHWDSMYYTLKVNDTAVNFYGPEPGFGEGAFFTSLRKCGNYDFFNLGAQSGKPHPDTIVVPIPDKNITAHISFTARNMPGAFQPGTFEGHQIYYAWQSASLAASYLGCGLSASSLRHDTKDYSGAPTYPGAPPGSGTGLFGLAKSFGGIHSDLYYTMMVFPGPENCAMQEPPYLP